MTAAPTTVKTLTFLDEGISFFAPRRFRRQRKGKDYRAFARELHAKLVQDVVPRTKGLAAIREAYTSAA